MGNECKCILIPNMILHNIHIRYVSVQSSLASILRLSSASICFLVHSVHPTRSSLLRFMPEVMRPVLLQGTPGKQ